MSGRALREQDASSNPSWRTTPRFWFPTLTYRAYALLGSVLFAVLPWRHAQTAAASVAKPVTVLLPVLLLPSGYQTLQVIYLALLDDAILKWPVPREPTSTTSRRRVLVCKTSDHLHRCLDIWSDWLNIYIILLHRGVDRRKAYKRAQQAEGRSAELLCILLH